MRGRGLRRPGAGPARRRLRRAALHGGRLSRPCGRDRSGPARRELGLQGPRSTVEPGAAGRAEGRSRAGSRAPAQGLVGAASQARDKIDGEWQIIDGYVQTTDLHPVAGSDEGLGSRLAGAGRGRPAVAGGPAHAERSRSRPPASRLPQRQPRLVAGGELSPPAGRRSRLTSHSRAIAPRTAAPRGTGGTSG